MSAASSVTMTDPVSEFRNTIVLLQSFTTQSTNNTIIDAVGQLIGTSDTAPIVRAYDILLRRCIRIGELIDSISEEDLDKELKEEAIQATSAVSALFDIRNHNHYQPAVRQLLRAEHLTALNFTARIIRRHHPLKKITGEQLKEVEFGLIQVLQETALTSSNSEKIPGHVAAAIIAGCNELLFVVENYKLFGQDELFEVLIRTKVKTAAIVRILKDTKSLAYVALLSSVLIQITDLISIPSNVANAITWYQGISRDVLTSTTPSLKVEPLQLEGPKGQQELEEL